MRGGWPPKKRVSTAGSRPQRSVSRYCSPECAKEARCSCAGDGWRSGAWASRRRRVPDLARHDLDNAQTLADRGPMPLFQADIHLTRARLFHDRTALAAARELIEHHGYGRRLDELADAETEALTWPAPEPSRPTPPPRTIRMRTPPWNPTLPPDIAILIALPEEFRTLAADYSHSWYPHPNPNHPGDDFLFLGPGDYRCCTTIMPRMGPMVAGAVAMRLLAMRPALIINVGIAGGFKRGDLQIGDVIAPRQVTAYDETSKIEGNERQARGSDYRPSLEILTLVQQLEFQPVDAYSRWQQDGATQLEGLRRGPEGARLDELLRDELLRDRPIISTEHLASGTLVVASKPFAESLRERNASIHAGEMEAAGMMAAAEYFRHPVKTLVVRGISDHVDIAKSTVDSIGNGVLRRLAMANAWRLVCALMGLGRLPRAAANHSAPL